MATQRRALPSGGEVPQGFQLASENGPIRFSSLFGDKQTLLIDGIAVNLRQRVAIAVTARSTRVRESCVHFRRVRRVHSRLREP